MAGKPKWTTSRKARQAENWAKARKREAEAAKNGHAGVSPKAHNGKTKGGYTPEKLEIRAAVRRAAALGRSQDSS